MTQKKELIYGFHAVAEAIHSGQELDRIFFRKDLRGEMYIEILNLARKHNVPFQHVPVDKINQFTRKNHQGVLALISPILYHDIEILVPQLFESGRIPLILILDGITDVRNFGAIARSAECAGVDALVVPYKGSASIQADAVKTSAGALMTIPVCRTPDMIKTMKFLKNSGFNTVGARERAEINFYEADFRDPLAIVMGSEEKGISGDIIPYCDQLVSIPVYGKISSLNVSVAASLLIYEAVRQRKS